MAKPRAKKDYMGMYFAECPEELHERVRVREHETEGRETKTRIGLAQFDSMQEYIEMYESLSDRHPAVHDKRRTDIDSKFYMGTKGAYGRSKAVKPLRTVEGIVNSAKSGHCHNIFVKQIDKYREMLDADNIGALQDTVKSIKRVTRFTDDGADLDIDRVMCGDTEYWRTTKRDGQYRVVRLVINIAMSYDNKAEDFIKLLAMTYVMAEMIEAKGYGLEIYACSKATTFTGYLEEQSILIPLKKAQEGLDVERMGVVGIVGFFRHVTFIMSNLMFGYYNGNCYRTSNEMRAFMGADVLVENTWTRGGKHEQRKRITKALDKLERGC